MNDNNIVEELDNNTIDKVKTKKPVNKKKRKKLLGMFMLMALTVLLLMGGTYAWFVGLGLVQVNAFDLEVTAGNQLELSLDAITWSNSVTISETTYDISTYPDNTNHGVGSDGLVPMSSVGQMDTTSNNLKLYAKTSLSSTRGGYRLVADQVDNSTEEIDGYFVFDLFIRNGKSQDYIETYNFDDDEDIYMKKGTDTSAVGAPSGGGDDYGIANSVRVALMQIGRIKAQDYSYSVAQGITCTTNAATHVTGLCNVGDEDDDTSLAPGLAKTWNIWEPNDAQHADVAIDRFNTICKKRTMVSSTLTYTSDSCDELEENTILTTYAVNQNIAADMGVDIYDGVNGYEQGTGEGQFNPTTYGLLGLNTLTDTEINIPTAQNANRQAIFRLAPNSITKVRVYMFIEGQDVDNYDMIYKGEKIKVKMAFTRDRNEMVETNPVSP